MENIDISRLLQEEKKAYSVLMPPEIMDALKKEAKIAGMFRDAYLLTILVTHFQQIDKAESNG